MHDYHSRIMNISADTSDVEMKLPYNSGHRDARHKAAEIATEADQEIERLKAEVAWLRSGSCPYCDGYDPSEFDDLGCCRGYGDKCPLKIRKAEQP